MLKKVLIFEKTHVWKAFVEMGNSDEAEEALSNLNNLKIFNCTFDGKMTIEYSNLIESSLSLKILDGKGEKKLRIHCFTKN